ncbi:MAG: hypothetical protein ABIV42_03865 [Nitrosospira sp.]
MAVAELPILQNRSFDHVLPQTNVRGPGTASVSQAHEPIIAAYFREVGIAG